MTCQAVSACASLLRMAQYTSKPLFVRTDPAVRAVLDLIKKNEPENSEAEIVRQALFDRGKRYAKPNGHSKPKPNGRKKE